MTSDVLKTALRKGVMAMRANLLPGVFLWITALIIILAYYFHTPSQRLLEQISGLKIRYGFLFSAISTSLFGGLLPFSFQFFKSRPKKTNSFDLLIFYITFWAVKGIEIDILYRLQAFVFGDNTKGATIIAKVLVDQFIYSPLWAVPSLVLLYQWQARRFPLHTRWIKLNKKWYIDMILPVMLASWVVWIPTVAFIYCLKMPLQLPVQNVILCLWCLMLMVITKEDGLKGVK